MSHFARVKKLVRPQVSGAALAVPPPEVHQENMWNQHVTVVMDQLSRLYEERLAPLEEAYHYRNVSPDTFGDEFKQRMPLVTFLGPFSSGKSSFINYLVQNEKVLPTGPHPVTDKFTIITYGERCQQVSGRVVLADPRLPFQDLEELGDGLVDHLCGVTAPHPVLKSVMLIDTPGVLEAAGDNRARPYNFNKVCKWFVDRSDMIFFIFDPTKLDLGHELKALFQTTLKGNESKIRIVLNKADTVLPQELLRVYGTLFWNLSNTIHTTEPPRIFVSSFWERPYQPDTDINLFDAEKEELLMELIDDVPLHALDNRVTKLVRRLNSVLGFALIASMYREAIDRFIGKEKARREFFVQYPAQVKAAAERFKVSEKIFPLYDKASEVLKKMDVKDIPDIAKLERCGWIDLIKKTLKEDIPALLQEPLQMYATSDPRVRRGAGTTNIGAVSHPLSSAGYRRNNGSVGNFSLAPTMSQGGPVSYSNNGNFGLEPSFSVAPRSPIMVSNARMSSSVQESGTTNNTMMASMSQQQQQQMDQQQMMMQQMMTMMQKMMEV
ncbi:sarcoplasmic reticulum glycoprotein [Strigomonas culicis]|uniref:Sarcoplasmic reticulum glycoprotein n=2 Tax=Strigomonas culicis TaxID=28005 RepID=S9U0V7_9TRYP|nr:sarcoplasmic reticulum glycoprotein [Strigomonas culicis]|eukprot:EPY24407.1 sarcoplasmic reticulum glycoprotein [Strigomonas culicis]